MSCCNWRFRVRNVGVICVFLCLGVLQQLEMSCQKCLESLVYFHVHSQRRTYHECRSHGWNCHHSTTRCRCRHRRSLHYAEVRQRSSLELSTLATATPCLAARCFMASSFPYPSSILCPFKLNAAVSSSFPVAFPIMTDDLPSPHRHVRLLARSQPSALQFSLAPVFPSCFRSSFLPFPWNIHSRHFPQYVLFISPHHQFMCLYVVFLAACVTLVVPRMCSFLVLSLHVTPHIHRSILI